ncbi:MAG: outer membrane lipoprotein-sorting protein [Alphaproteobacteria bacterium]
MRLRWLWVALSVALLAACMVGLASISFDPSARQFFAEENPDRIALDQFEAAYAKDENLMFVLAPKDGDVFTPRMLAIQSRLTECLWRLPFVRRINSLTNFQHTYAEGDDMIVRDLVPDMSFSQQTADVGFNLSIEGHSITPAQAAEARAIALSRIELGNIMVSPDGRVAQLQALFKLPELNKAVEVPMIVAETQAIRQQLETTYPDIQVKLSGGAMINNQFAVSGKDDGSTLTPAMFVIILVLVGVLLRSFMGVIMTLLIIMLSSMAGLASLGWTGTPLNSVTVLAPLIISILAVASTVHILASVRQSMMETADRREWARRALSDHMVAIAVACVTTAIGFFSLNFSISPPFRELGNVVGFGVLVAMALTLTLLPALITLLPMKQRQDQASARKWMVGLGEFVVTYRRSILPVSIAVVAGLGFGVTQLVAEDDFIRYFDERYEFREHTDFIEDNLTGVNSLEWSINSGEPEGINDPAYLANVSAFTDWLRSQPEVIAARSVTDTIKRLNMNMHGDDPTFQRLPDNREEASQYLFLYELSLNYGMDLTDQINVDRSGMRVSVYTPKTTTADLRDLTARANGWFDANAPALKTDPTGITYVFTLISHRDVRAMLTGTAVALVLISGIILIVLRDIKIGLISLIPNMIPALMGFGLWGYTFSTVTLAIAVVIAATLGIVVDDTVHFLMKYKTARRAGKSPEDAVRHVFSSVGMALLITTLALMAGFAVLAYSGFAVNRDLARLSFVTIGFALVADFFLLPALLIAIDTKSDRKGAAVLKPITSTAATLSIATLAFGILIALGLTTAAVAQSAEDKGLQIAVEADKRDLGWTDQTASGLMILRDARGNESRRAFKSLNMEDPSPDLGDKAIIVFETPRDIRGTALLTHSKVEPNYDDQWLYLPAIKRVKRISSSNRTGKFVSSEFSFEDLGSQEVGDFTYKWLRDEPCPTDASLTCFVSESYPKNQRSGYSKRVSWTDQAEYRLMQVDFYNRRGDLEKTLTLTDYNQYLSQYWRADLLRMVNKQTGKQTDLTWENYAFKTDLEERQFKSQVLPRAAR